MMLRDSLLVIAHRERFPDLAAALALVGAALDSAVAPARSPGLPVTDVLAQFADDDIESSPHGADGWSADDIQLVENSVAAAGNDDQTGGGLSGQGRSAHGSGPNPADPRFSRRFRGERSSVIAAIIDADSRAADDASMGSASSSYTSVPKAGLVQAGAPTAARTAFNMRTLSSTLHSMVRVAKETVDPDIDAVVAQIASGEPLMRVPMSRRLGPPRRICVLCELSLRSGPYRDDVRHLIRIARRLFSDGSLEFLTFKGTPARGCGSGPVWTWNSYAEQPFFDMTMIIGSGLAYRDGDPQELHTFAMQLIAADRPVCMVLIGTEPGIPTTRPYPQLLVQD